LENVGFEPRVEQRGSYGYENDESTEEEEEIDVRRGMAEVG